MIKDYMRKDLKDFKPYHAPIKPYEIKVDANENPFPHSPYVLEKINEWFEDKDNMTRYPDTDVHNLREMLSHLYNVSKDEVICTVGSDQLIELIIKVFVEPGNHVLVPNPSFSMYEQSTVLNHGKAIAYELDENFDYDYEGIIKAYDLYHPKLLFICTPNNPTGNKASKAGMLRILDHVKCPVIIDEAYEEFDGESMIPMINDYPGLIVLRTFSKAYGIAGLRIGYGIANKEMIDIIGIAKPPYNVSSFSQDVAGFILEDMSYYKGLITSINEARDLLMMTLETMDHFKKIYPTSANFILTEIKDIALVDYLQQHKVLVRGYGNVGRLASHMRITVGTQEENYKLIQLIKAFESKGGTL
jgi:histidinol-phosphate aminotransferase